MNREQTSPAQSNRQSEAAAPLNLYDDFVQQSEDDNRGLRISLAIAAVIHAALLLITFPNLYSEELHADKPEKKYLQLTQTPKFKPPPPPPTEAPKQRTKRIPWPDPTPNDPEPLRVEIAQVDITMPDADPFPFVLPERPPEPESTGPIIIGEGVVRPQRTAYVEPRYTELARKVRHEGIVILQTVIDTEGNVQDVNVLKSLNFGLTEAAVEAVKQWKYEAAVLNGKPVAVYLNLTVNFTLQ